MAYRFVSASTEYVEFAIAPLVGSLDATTVAVFLKRNPVAADGGVYGINSSALAQKGYLRVASDDKPYWFDGTNFRNGTQVMNSNTTWYLLVFTRAAGASVTPRFHVNDGSSWVHANASGITAPITVLSGDRPRAGVLNTNFVAFDGDIVAVGVKKSDSSDGTVETLSRTAWGDWTAYGFDWLIGFDSSLESGGILQDQGSAGTGDEVAISGTPPTQVSDPAGWSWAITLNPPFISSATTVYIPTITHQQVDAPFISATTAVNTPTLAHQGQAEAPFIADTTAVYTPTLTGSGTATLLAPFLAATGSAYTPDVSRFTAPFVPATTVVYTPTLRRVGLGAQPVGVNIGFDDDAGENAPTWNRLDA